MIGGKGNKTQTVENLERMHGITDDMETEEDTIDMAMTERFIFFSIIYFYNFDNITSEILGIRKIRHFR